jgi:hypothetical protein
MPQRSCSAPPGMEDSRSFRLRQTIPDTARSGTFFNPPSTAFSTLLSPLTLRIPPLHDHTGPVEDTALTSNTNHNFPLSPLQGSENFQPCTIPWAMALYDEGKIQARIDLYTVKLRCPSCHSWVDTGARAPSILSISQNKKYFTSFINHTTSKKCQRSLASVNSNIYLSPSVSLLSPETPTTPSSSCRSG